MESNIQRIVKSYNTSFEVARKYYTVLFELNNIAVTDTELSLVSYCAIHGTISTPPIRDEFMNLYNVPIGSIYNMISRLKKLGILVKGKDKKVRVNPIILPDFSQEQLIIALKLIVNGN